MRRITALPLLLLLLLFGACDELARLDGRSVDGVWRGRIDGEEVWMRLRDDRGEIRGSGDWGWERVYVRGDRFEADVYLDFDFDGFNPIEFEGIVRGREIDGRLYGSGLDGERMRFYRE